MKQLTLLFTILMCLFFGSVNAQSVLSVTSLGDNGAGSLRELVTQAFPNDTIRFQVRGTIYLASRISFGKSLVIDGPGMDSIIITQVSSNSLLTATTGDVVLKGLTFKGGYSSSAAYGAGGFTFSGTNLHLEDVKFDSCTADQNSSYIYGGGAKLIGSNIQIENCIFQKNYIYNDDGAAYGGGLYVDAGQVSINNSLLIDNEAEGRGDYNTNPRSYGGGLYLKSSIISIQNTDFTNNKSEAVNTYAAGSIKGKGYAYGGAFAVQNGTGGAVVVENCNFDGNVAYGLGGAGVGWRYSYAYGGAIYMSSTGHDFSLTNSTFNGNSASAPLGGANNNYGGAVVLSGADILVRNTDISNSSTSYATAAAYISGDSVNFEKNYIYSNSSIGLYVNGGNYFSVNNCLFSGNNGSAITPFASTTDNRIINSTFYQNTADEGGAIYLKNSTNAINILNCTIMDNFSNNSNGALSIYVYGATAYLKNNIISLPVFSAKPLVDRGTGGVVLSGGGNIIRDNSISGFLTQLTDRNGTDPILGTFANHGGRTNTFDLQSNSPAIDLGGVDTLSVDQRYFLRGTNIDAGAFEYGAINPSLPIASMATNNETLCGNDSTTLFVNASGAAPLMYQWFLNAVLIPGAIGSSYTISSASLSDAGVYRCHVSNSLDTVISDSLVLVVNAVDSTILNETICQGQSYSFDGQTYTTSGNYNKIETGSNGCDSIVLLNLTVMNSPTVSFINTSGQQQFCDNNNVVTLITNPSGGTFTGGGVNNNMFDPSNAGVGQHILSYSYTDINNCTGVMVDTYYVFVAPTVAIIALDTSYCDSIISVNLIGFPVGGLFAGTGVSGSAFSPAFAAVGQHNVTYTYTDVNNCSNTDDQLVMVEDCSILNNQELENSEFLKIYPNPARSTLYVETYTPLVANRMLIITTGGQVVKTYEGYQSTLDISQLVNGLYILSIETDEKVSNFHFVKQ